MFFKMEHCDVYYGQIQALYDINVEINPGEIISIIGANGAGKTTLMKSIMGVAPASMSAKSRRPVPSPAASSRWSPSHAA